MYRKVLAHVDQMKRRFQHIVTFSHRFQAQKEDNKETDERRMKIKHTPFLCILCDGIYSSWWRTRTNLHSMGELSAIKSSLFKPLKDVPSVALRIIN